MHTDPIVDEVHRVREELLRDYGGSVDALIEDANQRLLSGEFADFGIVTRTPPSMNTPSNDADG